jgi:hypothetical protein
MPEIILVRAEHTCWGCPSQWDAWDLDGRYWYLRYRGGFGSMGRDYDIDEAPIRFSTDDHGGVIELDEFCEQAGVTFAPEFAVRVTEFEKRADEYA